MSDSLTSTHWWSSILSPQSLLVSFHLLHSFKKCINPVINHYTAGFVYVNQVGSLLCQNCFCHLPVLAVLVTSKGVKTSWDGLSNFIVLCLHQHIHCKIVKLKFVCLYLAFSLFQQLLVLLPVIMRHGFIFVTDWVIGHQRCHPACCHVMGGFLFSYLLRLVSWVSSFLILSFSTSSWIHRNHNHD